METFHAVHTQISAPIFTASRSWYLCSSTIKGCGAKDVTFSNCATRRRASGAFISLRVNEILLARSVVRSKCGSSVVHVSYKSLQKPKPCLFWKETDDGLHKSFFSSRLIHNVLYKTSVWGIPWPWGICSSCQPLIKKCNERIGEKKHLVLCSPCLTLWIMFHHYPVFVP